MDALTRDYLSVEKLIRKISNSFVNKVQASPDDIFQEGCLAFVEAYPKYSPERGALTTFTYRVVMNKIIRTYLKKKRITVTFQDQMEIFCLVCDIPKNEMTVDAIEVLEVATACEGGKMKPASVRKLTRDYLKSEGWGTNRIEAAFENIRTEILAS
jgi:RNA polymerase sigma factor (sigma-70 family)